MANLHTALAPSAIEYHDSDFSWPEHARTAGAEYDARLEAFLHPSKEGGVVTAAAAVRASPALIKLLIISKGFGGGRTGQKWAYLQAQGGFELHMPLVPEFSEGSAENMRDKPP